MTTRTTMFIVLGLGAVALAQNKPDFSGVWAPVALKADAPTATGGAAALPPSDLTIRHSEVSLSVSRTAFDIVTTQTYKLDGSESTNKSGAVTRVTRSRWDGTTLIVEGNASQVTSAGYAAWTLKEVYSLNARGRLVIQSDYKGTDATVTTSTREYTKKTSK